MSLAILRQFVLFGLVLTAATCAPARRATDALETLSNDAPLIACREASTSSPDPWRASIQFNAMGTVAKVALRHEKQAPVTLRTSFDYKSFDNPEPRDEYSFPTGPKGTFVLTSRTGTLASTAVWRQGNQNILFDCQATDPSAAALESPASAVASSNTAEKTAEETAAVMRCYESLEDPEWKIELRLDDETTAGESTVPSTEITMQRKGEAPNIRRAKIEYRDDAKDKAHGRDGPSGQPRDQFYLILSRSERFHVNRAGPVPIVVWSRGESTTEFTCPVNVAH